MRGTGTGAVEWTWRLTLGVAGAGAVLSAGALVWPAAAAPLGVFGGGAILVAILGRCGTAIEEHYAAREFPPLPVPDDWSGQGARRRSMRRRSLCSYVFMLLFAGFPLLGLADREVQGELAAWLEIVLGAAAIGGCGLAGPAGRFVVTPEFLHIDTAFRRVSVPRVMLGGFARDGVRLRLDLTGGGHRSFHVDSRMWDFTGSRERSNIHCQARTAKRIVAALSAVPQRSRPGDTVLTRRRRGPLAAYACFLVVSMVVATLPA